MLYNFASSRPITLVFTHEPRYIHTFLYKKKLGRTPKINPHFLDFSKKSATRKTRFFRVGRNFGHRFLKKSPKSSIFWVPDLENFFDKLSIKKLGQTKNFGRDPPHRRFRAYFRKTIFEIFIFFHIFSREITTKFCSYSTKNLLFRGFLGKSLKKSEK